MNHPTTIPKFETPIQFRKWFIKNYKEYLQESQYWLLIQDLNFEGNILSPMYNLYFTIEDQQNGSMDPEEDYEFIINSIEEYFKFDFK